MQLTKFYSDKGVLNFSPKRGYHYLIARGNTISREVFLSARDPSPLLPVTPLIPGFEHVFEFELEWKESMPEQEAKRKGLLPILTYEKNTKTKNEGADLEKSQKMCMVFRKETAYYLLDREIHPFTLDFLSSDSGALKFLFNFTLKINDMNQVMSDFPAGNFLTVVEHMIIAELSGIFRSMKFNELRKVKDDKIQDDKQRIIDHLNLELTAHGFQLLKIILDEIIVMPTSQDRIDAEESVEVERLKGEALNSKADGEAKAAVKKGTAEALVLRKKGRQEAFVLQKKLLTLFRFRRADKKNIDKTTEIATQNLSYLTGTLVVGKALTGDESDDEFNKLLVANNIQTQNLTKKGGPRVQP